jgi:radical SAM superfamily enzyme YgiQ (UPF0313 family)
VKIKLIIPKFKLRPMDSEFKRLMSPPLALITLASLTPRKHEVYIEDENVKPINFNDNPDLVGITSNVDTAYNAYQIAGIYKKRGIPVVLGGIHVSANPDEAIKYADSVCIGEAENLWGKILEDCENKKLKQKYRNREPVDLRKIPVIDHSLINESHYLFSNITYASRNCPFKCEFCYNSNQHTGSYRNRPFNMIIEEIKKIYSKHIMFIDDNFIGNIEWTRNFIDKIKSLNLKWNAAVSANLVNNLDLLDKMKESGCKSLFIGFETINQKSLNNVKKHQNNISKYEKLINEIHQREIMINASLVFGFDSDHKNVFKETLNWLVANKIETMTSHILTPYPGTRLFEIFKNNDRIIDFNWSNYNTANVVFKPKNMTREELYEGYLWIYKEFYSFKNIIKRIPKNRQIIPYLLFNFCYRKFGKFTSGIAKNGFMKLVGRLATRLAYQI